MPKTLVTHVIPHLDDVAGFWLLMRFDSACRNSKMKFVTTAAKGITLRASEIGIGVGRGKYDEHKGDRKDSATSLIWKDLKRRGLLPKGVRGKAVAEIADYVRRGDLGEFIGKASETYGLTGLLRAIPDLPGHDSMTATEIGLILLDATLKLYEDRISIDAAIRRGLKFRTKWGRGVAITSSGLPAAISNSIAEKGYVMVVVRFAGTSNLHIRCTPGHRTDLSKLAALLMKEEPEAEWYFHHSKKMLLQGDRIARKAAPTRYTPKTMAKKIAKLYA